MLCEEFEKKFKKAAKDHLEKNVEMLLESEPGKAYATLKKMGAQPGDNLDDGSFNLIEHLEANLTSKESVEKIATHFAQVSQEYPALNIPTLPSDVRIKLDDPEKLLHAPVLSESDIEQKILKAKKPKSGVPGDLPRRIVQNFPSQLARPFTQIFNNIIKSGEWPSMWKVEHGIPLKKCINPTNEDDLRVISLTAFFSKVFEKFVMEWLLHYLSDLIDIKQYGGQKGSSIAHYLIDFINFVLYNQDLKNIHAVLAVAVDFSKAFNRQIHNILITLLSDLGVPGWLLSIVIGFLQNRELLVFFKGEKSEKKSLPGGGPQGTLLGMFLFLILINAAGFRDQMNETGNIITKPFNKREAMKKIHLKYIDDMTAAEAINLKERLLPHPDPNQPRPLRYHDRTEHILKQEDFELQNMLDELKLYANQHEMVMNKAKTKVILFNQARKYDFFPELSIEQNENLEVVEEIKLLGVLIRSDLSWCSNTEYMCNRAFARLWLLRRLKAMGASDHVLLDVYQKQIRCTVEFAVPAWASSLKKYEITQIERVQKAALAIIYQTRYKNYDNALRISGLEPLSVRRTQLCLKFAKKAYKNPKYKHWFCENLVDVNTRSRKLSLKPVKYRTDRFRDSPISYLTKLLNEDKK